MEKRYMTSKELLEKSEILYTFVDMFSSYENVSRDYGTGECFSMTEVHILNAIDVNPGITGTDLAEKLRRTKGFISQVLSKLEKKEYVIRIPSKNKKKYMELYVTAKGKQLCLAHNEFDEKQLLKTYHYLMRDCTEDEIVSFYKVMQVYINIMNAAAAKHKRLELAEKEQKDSH